MNGLSFISGGELFAVDVTLVQKVTRKIPVTPVPTAPDAVVGVANLKGRVVTILSLDSLLGHVQERGSGTSAIRPVNAIVFKPASGTGDQMGLLIDKPGSLITINDGSLVPPPTHVAGTETPCISGVAEEDGRLYRIIDVDMIIKRFKAIGEKYIDI